MTKKGKGLEKQNIIENAHNQCACMLIAIGSSKNADRHCGKIADGHCGKIADSHCGKKIFVMK